MDERVADAISDGADWASRQFGSAPRRLFGRWIQRLPLHFRVLYQQFLLRVIDLESLSIEADIPRFLGQFAGILLFCSIARGVGMLFFPPPPAAAIPLQQSQFSLMMLIAGLITVITWDSIFPDRRDVMILAPLPVRPHIILFAKLAASAGLIGLAVFCFNCASGFALCGFFAGPNGFLRCFLAWWFTMAAASAFLYCAVLTVQGLTALLLPRGLFLRLSAVLQLAAFALFLSAYFLAPTLPSLTDFAAPANRTLVARMPSYWFVALFNQLAGRLPSPLTWLAIRAWIALGSVVAGAGASLLLCYTHTMKKTVEQPDLVPGAPGFLWIPRFGGSLGAAIAFFSLRSITRSRQHRLALAFSWSIIFALALAWLRSELKSPPEPINLDFLISTFLMMGCAVLGLRGVFSLPISLRANWMLRVTQLRPTTRYLAATRLCLLLFGVAPICIIAAAFSFHFTPWQPAARHLAFLALAGWVLVELGLVRFYKVPFTCSYLPGKTNIQVIFWGFVFVFFNLGFMLETYELGALTNLPRFFTLMALAAAAAAGLSAYNRIKAKAAMLYFEELPPEIITKLGLLYVPPAEPCSTPRAD
jgi:hypothetical protein